MRCRLCEVHLTVQHPKSKNVIKAYRKEHPRPLSRVRVTEARPISFPVQCQNCENPSCVIVCLLGTMYQLARKKDWRSMIPRSVQAVGLAS